MPVLDVRNLRTYFSTQEGTVRAVDNVSFSLDAGEALGFAGESGCGKTTSVLSVMRLLPYNGRIVGGRINFNGRDLAKAKAVELRKVRWKEISIVFQGAMNSLNPVIRVAEQVAEPIILHEDVDKEEAMKRVGELLEMVGINRARMHDYPHEFSGGMRQRVMIAMALACNPKVVIADEPVTALDVMIQAQILALINRLREELDLSLILISHDLSVIAETCEKIAIMYAGKIVEIGNAEQIFKSPKHPYTQGLVKAFPDITGPKYLPESIPGMPPSLIHPPAGCRFSPRCKFVMPQCHTIEPPMISVGPTQFTACHLYGKEAGS